MKEPVLLLLHGFPLDARIWEHQVRGLGSNARVLAPDLRGFGESKLVPPEVCSMEDHAADLKAYLDQLGIDRVILCGLSMGGYIAFSFLERWPERVNGLILCNTRATADTADGRQARRKAAEEALERGMDVIARGMLPKLLSQHTRDGSPEIVEHVHRIIREQDPRAAAASSLGMALRPDRLEFLPNIALPTLIITGAEDTLMPLATSEEMHRAIPASRLVVLNGCAHLCNVEDPTAFNHAVRSYLGSL